MDSTGALCAKYNKGKAVEAQNKQQLASASRDMTKGWTMDQCTN